MPRLTSEEKLKIALDAGFTVISEALANRYAKPSMYIRGQCLICQAKRDIRFSHLKNGEVECKDCKQKDIIEKAAKLGLEYNGPPKALHKKPTDYYNFKFVGCTHSIDMSRSAVRKAFDIRRKKNKWTQVECDICREVRFAKEAKRKGLVKLSDEIRYKGKSGYREYKPIHCDHHIFLQPADIREIINEYTCVECNWTRFKEEGLQKGVELIQKSYGRYYRYKFLSCSHKVDLAPSQLKIKEQPYRCEICTMKQLAEGSKRGKIKWIKNVEQKSGYHLWQFKNCGHRQEIGKKAISNNQFHCRKCHENKLIHEAIENGFELLGKPLNNKHNFKRYKHTNCGHEDDYAVVNMRALCACKHCNDTNWKNHSILYLLKLSYLGNAIIPAKTWLKLGHAQDILTRIDGYGLPDDFEIEEDIEILKNLHTHTRFVASKYEGQLSEKFKYFNLSHDEMKKYHSKSGITECYDLEALEEMTTEISKLSEVEEVT